MTGAAIGESRVNVRVPARGLAGVRVARMALLAIAALSSGQSPTAQGDEAAPAEDLGRFTPILAQALRDGRVLTAANTPGCESGPRYSSSARQAGQAGAAILLVHVGVQGRVDSVVIAESSGSTELDNVAAGCVIRGFQGLAFKPQLVDGKPVAHWQPMKWTFKLQARPGG